MERDLGREGSPKTRDLLGDAAAIVNEQRRATCLRNQRFDIAPADQQPALRIGLISCRNGS